LQDDAGNPKLSTLKIENSGMPTDVTELLAVKDMAPQDSLLDR
jgi:hypothetical protein